MRALLITLVLALVAVLAMAEVKAPVCNASRPGVSPSPVATADWARIQGLLPVEPAPRSIDFPCPTVSNCSVNCLPSAGTTVDTEERACRADDNSVFHCPGLETIHVTSGSCHQAPCCTQIPACFCGPCGSYQTWTCA
jgi:hypothetical protein